MKGSDSLRAAMLAAPLPARGTLLVALSGGADSVALLVTAVALASAERPEWSVVAGHVHHGLRGAEADADGAFVEHLSRRLGVPLAVRRVDTASRARQQRVSIETAARELRYGALEEMRVALGANFIVTGHTADDQAETVVMRLLRGAGLHGLSSIRARRDRIYRPFLGVRRPEVVAALQEWGQGYRLDITNRDQRFMRNRIRQQVMPLLEGMAPGAVPAIGRAAATSAEALEYLEAERQLIEPALLIHATPGRISASLHAWRCLHPSLRHLALRQMVASVSGGQMTGAEYGRVEEVLCQPGGMPSGERQFGARLWVGRWEERLTLSIARAETTVLTETPLTVPGEARTTAGRFTVRTFVPDNSDDLGALLAVCGPNHALVDADALGSKLTIRSRRVGDRIRLTGGTRKLQDVLVDRHVPRRLRDAVPVLANDRHIVWLPGLALDSRVGLTDTTVRVAHLEFQSEPNDVRGRIAECQ